MCFFEGLGSGADEAVGWGGELGVVDGCAVAAEEDGVHDCEGAADAEDEAQEETDDGAVESAHGFDDVMRDARTGN